LTEARGPKASYQLIENSPAKNMQAAHHLPET
jgi:hypothetical protein